MDIEATRIINILKEYEEFFKIPILVDDGKDVFIKSYKLMSEYKEMVQRTNIDNNYFEASIFIVDRLEEVFESYLKGEILQANEKINKIFSDKRKLKDKLNIEHLIDSVSSDELRHLYKARLGSNYAFSKKEMFHIPFLYRGITKNQRYSINGIPCLYLGTSSYICWEECGRPDFNSFWISRFKLINDKIKILNLAYTIEDIEEIYRVNPNKNLILINNFIITSIIRSLSSISVKNTKKLDRPFREEYIIPQLIMQNLYPNGIDGILYLSTKNMLNDCSTLIMRNLAFPASDYNINNFLLNDIDSYNKTILSKKLTDSFELSDPINLGILTNINNMDSVDRAALGYQSIMANNRFNRNNARINASRLPYQSTNFFVAEIELQTMQTSHISQTV